MRKNLVSIVSIVFIISCVEVSEEAFSHVMKEGGKTYIVDRTRNRWDVTQAESLGFEPDRFQYGLGKNAFTPLDDRHLADQGEDVPGDLRVIGVAEGNDARAYSVPKLRYHEISNSTLGEKPIAVGYWPLADLAAVYSRTIDSRVLTIVPSGWTYDNTFVLYDRETETLWYPYRKGLKGIQGEYFNRWLPKLSSKDTKWKNWQEKFPGSKILK